MGCLLNRQKQYFDNCFEVFLADTRESKKIHYQLRYRVYCDEMGFDDKERFPAQQEIDEWDKSAVHFLVRHKYTQQWLGGLRMVTPKGHVFPFQESSSSHQRLPRGGYKNSVEISRLCVTKEARRFAFRNPAIDLAEENRKISFLHDYRNINRDIMWGLYRAAAVYSVRQGIKHWYMLANPALAYSVKKQGFDIQQIGDASRQSTRMLYYLSTRQVLENSLLIEDYRHDFRLYSDIATDVSVDMGGRQVKQIGVISYVSRI
ncbi:PEP-CTERM/exosortase system-associated acyltransferase [Methylomonas fluvii]|uniref:PEP-CTERM/exosortase system-associated acyltransferase n=1 Tax=Methylomonas fluvii TaxID=1854564 RepID=UPI00352D51BD